MKESLSCINNKCIFRETFNSFDAVKKNGGDQTDVSLSNGVGTFDGSGSKINYGVKQGLYFGDNDFTVRLKFTPSDLTPSSNNVLMSVYDNDTSNRCWGVLLDTSGILYFISSGDGSNNTNVGTDSQAFTEIKEYDIILSRSGTSVSFYFDGELVSTSGNIVATLFDSNAPFIVGNYNTPDLPLDGDIDLVEIYDYALSANEVSLLHAEQLNVTPAYFGTALLEYDFVKNQTNFDEAGNATSPTDTDTSYLEQGLYCNGSTTAIDTNLAHADLDLTGDITIEAIVNTISFGANGGRILDNSKLIFSINLDALVFSSNGTTFMLSTTGSILINDKPNHCIITRNTAGNKTNIYVDGILSGDADRNSGTPVAGDTDIFIGDREAGDRTFNGVIKNVNVYSGLMTAEQVAQRYQYWKNRGYLQ